jgi:hypothetical protein
VVLAWLRGNETSRVILELSAIDGSKGLVEGMTRLLVAFSSAIGGGSGLIARK